MPQIVNQSEGRGRPPRTTREEVARVALALFVEHGFEETTMSDIAAAAGIARRSVFRYYASKNDIVWGDFDEVCRRLRRELDQSAEEEPPGAALRRAVIASNAYDEEELPELRLRMRLITSSPSLQGHSMLRYAAWRAEVAAFAGRRLGLDPSDLVPQAVAHGTMAAAMAAYVHWVGDEEADLAESLDTALSLIADDLTPLPR